MSFSTLILHPIVLVISEVIVTSFAISFTHPSSLFRPAALPLVIVATWLVVTTSLQHIPRIYLASIGPSGPTYLLRYIDLVLLSRWSYETSSPTNSPEPRNQEAWKNLVGSSDSSGHGGSRRDNPRGTVLDRLGFGLHVTFSPRHVNTPWQVKNVPHFSSGDPRYVPSRRQFYRRNAIVAIVCYVIVDFFSLSLLLESNALLFAPQNVPFFARLQDISMQEMATRIASSLTLWLHIYCILRIQYSIFGIVAVGTGLSEVSAWRPPFGRLADAYTVRHFWGNFWHQTYRQSFSSIANFLVDDIFKLTRYRLLARYSKILAAFFVSGLLHLLADLAMGISLSETGSMRFFCIQAIGIALEDGVQAIYRYMNGHGRSRTNSSQRRVGLAKMLGYVWVMAFLSWSTPAWAYPAIRLTKGEAKDRVLPFSPLRLWLGRE